MISGAAGHDDDDVIRLLNDPQRPLTVPILDTVGASNAQDIHVALADLLEGDTGVLEQGKTHPLLVEALFRRNRGMLGAEDDGRLLAHEHVVGAGDGGGARDRFEHLVGAEGGAGARLRFEVIRPRSLSTITGWSSVCSASRFPSQANPLRDKNLDAAEFV